jgi:starch synthase
MVASEVYPFSKTGGLGDVMGALPAALAAGGHDVLVISPWYDTLAADPAPLWIGDVSFAWGHETRAVGVGTLERDGVQYAFVGHASFRRGALYGFADDVERFLHLSASAPAVWSRVGFEPDVVHLHDWQAAPLAAQLKVQANVLPTVLTVHNLQHQGHAESGWLHQTLGLGLPSGDPTEFVGSLALGLRSASTITTVSPTYAQEIQTPAFGFGLDALLASRSDDIVGIVNGIDVQVWNPAADPWIEPHFSEHNLEGKASVRRQVLAELGLAHDGRLLACVTRLADQKGLDVLTEAAEGLLEDGWQLAVLGTGSDTWSRRLRDLERAAPGGFSFTERHDERLAHRLLAGADGLLVPSHFEPCGLTQLVAMRYGTIPIVHATGGLADTVQDGVTGVTYAPNRAGVLQDAVQRVRAWIDEGADAAVRQRGMQQDVGWSRAAERYSNVYKTVLEARS